MQLETFGVGKLPMNFLHTMLERYGGKHERLVVGPRVGEDAAVLDMGTCYLVAKSDPITFATDRIGWYVVHVNANDIAAMGATPRWLLLTLLLPEGHTDREMVEAIFSQAGEASRALGIVLCGGHTEITFGLERPIAVGLMLGEVEKPDLVCTAGAQVGDDVIVTKGIAIEGTALLASEMGQKLADQVDADVVARGRRFLDEPGISVVRDAEIVCQVGRPTAMHDPTEGGLATGLLELALASGKGIEVDLGRVPILPETVAFCQALELDPLGLIASGALLVTAAPGYSGQMVDALAQAGIQATIIGKVVGGGAGVQHRVDGSLMPIPSFERDEVARVFEGMA
jgi:hydrogenase expression/formation protein HypE